MLIISAGFDARHGDPLGRLELTDEDYRDLTGLVLEMAHHHAEGRVVSILEGRLQPVRVGRWNHCPRGPPTAGLIALPLYAVPARGRPIIG